MTDAGKFGPGKNVHPIQARIALEGLSTSKGARIIGFGTATVDLEVDGAVSKFACMDAERLRGLAESGRCVLSDGTRTFGLLSPKGVLVVLASEDGATTPPLPRVDPTVVLLEGGAAICSPTDGGAWHLFAVAPAQ